MQGGAIPVASLGFFESRVAGCSFSTNPALFYHHLHPILPPSRIFPVLVRPRSTRFQSARVQFSVGEYGHSWPGEPAMEEAREAIMEILREYGASEDDTARIASNSPQYLDMIVGNVLELDEHSLWSSWGPDAEEGGEDIASRTFREKVRCMAKSKRDGGLLPFLESIGVRNSSAMLIARYLVSEKLPDLIDKVKFVKEMLSSSSENISVVGKNARRMMMHLSIFADDDIQETLAFFEKMESRNGGLSMLDQGDTYFAHLIESFPKLLLLSIENHLKPLADFLLLVGVPMASIRSVLLLYPPIIFYDIENDIKSRLDVLKKAGFEKDIGKILIKYPWFLSSSVQKNYDNIVEFFTGRKVVSFLKLFGFDDITIGRILCRCPEIFAANVDDTLQRKVNILTDFGISRKFLPRVIRKYPELLLLDVNTSLLPRMRYLMDIGLSKEEVSSMVSRFSPLLGYSIEAVFKPKLEFLQTIMQKPLKEIVEYPRYFSYSLDKKIKPRFWVLKSRNIACSLKDMLGKNNEEFAEEYMGIGRLLVPPAPVPPEVDQ
ncbi:transcription termination factor MTERF5, chloroplastic isoform X3 [Phalaenopsis equestris]|uniref:transcription termination factor MTERF5, chloroplastic isoform X3 n=1 Tax=Phalaenopsis equestris TaxID=78828 RepID=UPI0009E37660|nr:transcription termination factor MTERF5, chloroplastic isoform X3 [Phalaenopsis equestris]